MVLIAVQHTVLLFRYRYQFPFIIETVCPYPMTKINKKFENILQQNEAYSRIIMINFSCVTRDVRIMRSSRGVGEAP
jgi:hypothetical protein